MSLLEQIAGADERGLATSALACLERCLPPAADGGASEPLRPLWASCEDGRDWGDRLEAARAAMAGVDETASPVPEMLGAAPSEWAAEPLRAWARTCSLLSLEFHRLFDMPVGAGASGDGPLVAGELRRQSEILETLAESPDPAGGARGLLGALERSTEGRRVLRAVISRRARGRG
ncbi:hypothetical protein [Streptomyces fulvorobeus]|uniref:Uncharacterized protein n=1 Tax=Streptomyces fulvorobeus TaxID=284028 RepID=A0A7J0CB47_9ACTN|nr:hypothetical protein [Streptomyces fulvorobeus]NYE42541.1 hypothetical protein [Streptomyces fulvorobeus]GFM98946.1 hypothetical protein Sfulv_37570 [Streptomyces fulvorobeus]